MAQLQKMSLLTTRNGFPCAWEEGGATNNGGSAILVGDMNGESKKALFVRMTGILANREHALVRVDVNDIVVRVEKMKDDIFITVNKIKSIGEEVADTYVTGLKLHKDLEQTAVEAAEKAAHYRKQLMVKDSITYQDNGPTIRVFYQYISKFAVLEEVGRYAKGEWEIPLPKYYNPDIVDAAISKASTINCKTPFYVVEREMRSVNE